MTQGAERAMIDSDMRTADQPPAAEGATPAARPGRHRAVVSGAAPTAPEAANPPRPVWVFVGWVLVASTGALVIAARVRSPEYVTQGVDDVAFRNALPNVVCVLLLTVGLLSPWLSGLASTPSGAWRDGDHLAAVTMLGVRHVRVPGAWVVPFRMSTNAGTLHGALVVDRRARPLLLMDSFSPARGRIDRLLDRRPPASFWSIVLEYVLGVGVILVPVAVVFLLLFVVDQFIAPIIPS